MDWNPSLGLVGRASPGKIVIREVLLRWGLVRHLETGCYNIVGDGSLKEMKSEAPLY
jgi:hypothetical protein